MSGPSQVTKKSDIIVVGSGPLGWACAQLLSKNKIKTLLIDPCSAATPSSPPGWLEQGLGVFWPSLNDPPTRAVVAHGIEMAQWLQDFCANGICVAETLLGKHHIQRVPTFRLALENHELVELKAACQAQLGLMPHVGAGEGIFAEKIDAALLRSSGPAKKSARKDIDAVEFYSAKALKIEDAKDVCRVYLDDGKVCESEMVILATGYHIADLEPWLAHMLIPMSDVHTLWKTKIPAQPNTLPVPFRAASGHVAGIFSPQPDERGQWFWSLRLTGPRFLLPQAGAGVDLSQQPVDAALPKKIESWISKQLLAHAAPLLAAELTSQNLDSVASTPLQLQSIGFGVDCLPCDELPMLGELGHQGRILGATGWLGCGWSAGFQAAAVLTEIVQNGKAENLKGLLRPSRWRSGMNEGVGGVTGMT